MKYKKEKSCGTIIINDKKVLLVYSRVGKHWGFPKGHVEEGETEVETALRETKEEVGLDVEIIDENKRYILEYIVEDKNIDKTVIFFLASLKDENQEIKIDDYEIEEYKWCFFDEVEEILDYDNAKKFFKEVRKDL